MVITVSNQKGGVGKTTTSAALAAGFSMAGKKVLCMDSALVWIPKEDLLYWMY